MHTHHSSCSCRSKIRAVLQCFLLTMGLIGLSTPLVAAQTERGLENSAWLAQQMTLADARHLAGRAGLGASPEELNALMHRSRKDAVHVIVDAINTQPHLAMPAWVNAPAPHFWTRRFLSQSMKQVFDADRDKEIVQLRRWWVNNMLQTSSPQTERLVLFWHDHFATSYEGVDRRSVSMARQNQMFRQMGTGSYRALLKAVIKDPAMITYLDNQSNRKGYPNENFARELLELFTLGEGNFDEATVKEAARALTGYGISATNNLSFKLHGHMRDMNEKTLFGKTGKYDGDALIDLILEQPEAAEHLVKKFWHAFISDAAPSAAFIKTFSNEFRETDYDIKSLYTSLLMSEAFWDSGNRLALIKSPVTLIIGTARSLDYPKRAWTQMPSLLALLGMNLFSPPNVAGWNEGAAFVVPGRLLNRQLAMKTLLSAPNTPTMPGPGIQTISSDSENQMVMSSTMAPPDQSTIQSPLQVRLAGHLYEGAPQYKVSLYGSNEALLWTSDERALDIGYDTEAFGKMQDMSQLAWQTIHFQPPASALSKSVRVTIAFLNDAAGKTGDRNLFIESVSINGKSFATIGAQQNSRCPPNNPRDAGRLYCAGTVAVELNSKLNHSVARDAAFTASSASLIWAQHKKKKISATVALENVQTPQGDFHTVSFHVTSNNENELEISLDSFGCWPSCIEQWPECAWVDDRSQEKSLSFPLRRGQDAQIVCHYESLTDSEQELVNAIYVSLPGLVTQLADTARNARQKAMVRRWQERIGGFEPRIKSSVYGNAATPFSFNQHYTQASWQAINLQEPRITIDNVDSFFKAAKNAGLSAAQLLIGGVPAESRRTSLSVMALTKIPRLPRKDGKRRRQAKSSCALVNAQENRRFAMEHIIISRD